MNSILIITSLLIIFSIFG
ncbi:hypothetical protein, partial [Escherichia coli]